MNSPIDFERYKTFFVVTNELYKLKLNPKSLTKEDYLNLLAQICNGMTEALTDTGDGSWADAVRALDHYDEEVKQEARHFLTDQRRYSELLIFSSEALVKCGALPETVDGLKTEIKGLQDQLRGEVFDPEVAIAAIEAVKFEVCQAEGQVRYDLDSRNWNYTFRTYAMKTGGTGLLFASIGTAIASGGGTAPLSIALGTAGTALLANAKLGQKPGKKRPR